MEHISHIWPTVADLASDLGRPYPTVAAWKQRGRIPADYDFDLIAAAKKRGHRLTLAQLAAARRARHGAGEGSHSAALVDGTATAQPALSKKQAADATLTGGA